MKKILLLLALLATINSYAQDSVHVTATLNMTEAVYIDSAFGGLDTMRMTTKYLLTSRNELF